MCGRFAMPWDPDQLADRLGLDTDESAGGITPSYNTAPGMNIAVVRRTADGRSLLSGARWNLIPAWSDTGRLPYPTFNARVETAADKPVFRDGARHGRILIPMLGYYEWDSSHRPHWFHMQDGRILLAAGLLSTWRGTPTCTILTRQAEDQCAEIHDRMPVLIPNDASGRWLDPTREPHTVLREASQAAHLMTGRLDSHQVAPLHGDGPELIKPVPSQETLFAFDEEKRITRSETDDPGGSGPAFAADPRNRSR